MVVRELVALLGVKTDTQSFNKAEKGMDSLVGFAKKAAGAIAGFFAVRWIKNSIDQVTQLGDTFQELTEKTGVSTDQLQRLKYAAEQSDTSFESMQVGIKKLQIWQDKIAKGGAEESATFEKLGVSIYDASGRLKPVTDLLIDLSGAFNGLQTDSERTALAVKLFGRSGNSLIPFFKAGADGIQSLFQELDDLGGLMNKDLVAAGDQYRHNIDKMKVALLGWKIVVTNKLLPILMRLQNRFLKWYKLNKTEIKKWTERVLEVVKAVVQLLDWGWKLIKMLYKMVEILPAFTKIALLTLAFLNWGKGMLFAGKAVRILMSPLGKIGILIGLLYLIIQDLVVWVQGGESVFGKFFETLDEITGLNISGPMKDIIKWFMALAEDPITALEELRAEWRVVFESIFDTVSEFLGPKMTAALTTFWQYWTGFWDNMFLQTWDDVAKFWEGVYQSIIDWVTGIFDKITSIFGLEARNAKIENFLKDKLGMKFGPPTIAPAVVHPAPVGPYSSYADQRSNIKIDIKATPGMDERRLASEVSKQVGNEIQKQNRAALRSLTPGTVGAKI